MKEYGEEQYEGEEFTDNDPLETVQDTEISAEEKNGDTTSPCYAYAFHVEKHMTEKIF